MWIDEFIIRLIKGHRPGFSVERWKKYRSNRSKWFHSAFVFDEDKNRIFVYYNGVLKSTVL